MPSEYDEMTERAHISYEFATPEAKRLREMLRSAMSAEGFSVYEPEWWHYDYKDWKEYPIMNVRFEDIGGGPATTRANKAQHTVR